MKWQAAPGILVVEEKDYNPRNSPIITPGNAKQSKVYKVLSVGPGVKGIKEGDLVSAREVAKLPSGDLFIRATQSPPMGDIWGRLVPDDAPNSAVAITDNGEAIP